MSKREILKAFKKLHRICQETFLGDTRALTEARARINMEFKSNIIKEELPEKLKVANDVGEILKVQVVQAVKSSKSDNFELRLKKDTAKMDNYVFKDDVELPSHRSKKCKPDVS